jgi:hypothetical protein
MKKRIEYSLYPESLLTFTQLSDSRFKRPSLAEIQALLKKFYPRLSRTQAIRK